MTKLLRRLKPLYIYPENFHKTVIFCVNLNMEKHLRTEYRQHEY